MKIFPNDSGIYLPERKFKKIPERDEALMGLKK